MSGEECPSILVSKPLLWWLAAPSDNVRSALLGDASAVNAEPLLVQLPGENVAFYLSLLPLVEDPNGLVLARLQCESRPVALPSSGEDSLLQLVLDSIPIGVFWKDRDLRFDGCNQRFAKDAGVSSPFEVVGKTDLEMLWAKEDSEGYMRDDRKVMQGDVWSTTIRTPRTATTIIPRLSA